MMAKCMRLTMRCAAICYAAAQMMSLEAEQSQAICSICAEICDQCSAECEKHDNPHCRKCAAACEACAEECRMMVMN